MESNPNVSILAHQPGPVQDFHKCLLEHTDYGNIDRQEAVSMLPVLLLDVQSGHRILDMCASPGSKTTQILDLIADGMVVANDMNKKRAYMLVHRLSRNTLQSAVVTCGPGQLFPGLYTTQDSTNSPTSSLQTTNVFDRVLCDVPCSGDGTLRKSQTLWKEWHIGQGLTLFPTQLALALRGAALVKVGGIMVYSTCSFNPVEDEAVVAELLRRSDGALEVVDVAEQLPGLVARPGRTAWSVGWRSKSKSSAKGHVIKRVPQTNELHHWFDDYNDVPAQLQGDRILRCMFPPSSSAMRDALRRCMRLVPTDGDSGGFFIAVLRKTKNLPGDGDLQEGLPPLDEVQAGDPPTGYVCKLCEKPGHYMKLCPLFDTVYDPDDEPSKAKKAKVHDEDTTVSTTIVAAKESPYRRITDDVWTKLESFYGFKDHGVAFRQALWSRSDSSAQINYVHDNIVNACMAGGDALQVLIVVVIVNTGLKVFSKTSDGFFRPTSEGLAVIRPFLTKRVLHFSLDDFQMLVARPDAVPFAALAHTDGHESTKALAELPLGPAVGVLLLPPTIQGDAAMKTWPLLQDRLLCNLWLGKGSFMPRLSALKRAEMTELLRAYCGVAAN
ncbi:hypothetical protein DYB30_004407 [Aphanomyces astaci]|uniref:SAM-dependent MTase RsmB/NOP-type domain-containing protein n=1 Tax=Aphanomyces astaci TaxID=112090 RepID=A0A397DQ58_APHAT|nr:hypothetical protein DYB34_000319 [Aphanomyces astaci]RHY68682.1 hypothetical protein DYB30_004407 [Aphanomyces astaci]